MTNIDELLAQLLEEPEEVLGVLADVVNRGRLSADDLSGEILELLGKYDLVSFLIQRAPRQRVRTWVYPSPLGLRLFAVLEREAEREAELQKAATVRHHRRGKTGVKR